MKHTFRINLASGTRLGKLVSTHENPPRLVLAAKSDVDLKEWVEAEQIKIGQVIHALRVAVTGKAAGFGMFETLAILGKEKCLTRIDWACQRAAQNAS